MPGLLSTIQTACATHGAAIPFFNPAVADPVDTETPAVPFFYEQLKSVDQKINDVLLRLGLAVLVATVVATDARNSGQGITFKDIAVVFRVYESPTINASGVTCSDCAEAIAWHFKRFSPIQGAQLVLKGIALGQDPKNLVYDVLFTIEAAITAAPTRS